MHEQHEMFNKEIKSIVVSQAETLERTTTMTAWRIQWELQQQTQPSRRISELEYRSIKIIQPEKQNEKERNRVKKAYMNYMISFKEIIYALVDSQKETRRNEQKAYLKK